jgi:hypothetical protein
MLRLVSRLGSLRYVWQGGICFGIWSLGFGILFGEAMGERRRAQNGEAVS